MWHEWFRFDDTRRSHSGHRPDPNLDRLVAVALGVALALFLASHVPAQMIAPVARDLLAVAALGAALVATLRGERIASAEVTAWDQAALYMLASVLAGFFVEPEALDGMGAAAAMP